jgi:hypothetical protein
MVSSPLATIGLSLIDYRVLKKYLRVPRHYLLYILARNRDGSLRHVPATMGEVVRGTHKWLKESLMINKEDPKVSFIRAHGVPPQYAQPSYPLPKCAGQTLNLYHEMLTKINGLSKAGKVLYFYSEFEEQAMIAATNLIKKALDTSPIRASTAMMDFPTIMDNRRKFEGRQEKAENTQLSCFYLLGTEYVSESGFTEAHLGQLVRKRRVAGKTTILVSHLTPMEFEHRYHMSLESFGAVTLKFNDEKSVAATISSLLKELHDMEA